MFVQLLMAADGSSPVLLMIILSAARSLTSMEWPICPNLHFPWGLCPKFKSSDPIVLLEEFDR